MDTKQASEEAHKLLKKYNKIAKEDGSSIKLKRMEQQLVSTYKEIQRATYVKMTVAFAIVLTVAAIVIYVYNKKKGKQNKEEPTEDIEA